MRRLRLATRGSALALVQSRSVASALESLHPGLGVEVLTIQSEGDRQGDLSLSRAGGQGLFTRALEDALLRGEADFAVHSLKDLPTALPAGLALAAIGVREDWRDAWISPAAESPWDLPPGARVGTGSPRRRAQLARRGPGLRFEDLRGNVDTRLRKVAEGAVDGAVLALAGLKRLGLEGQVRRAFGEDEMLPAPGQGFLALETPAGGEAYDLCRAFNDAGSEAEAACERAFLERLESGCMAPVGALARTQGSRLSLRVFAGLAPDRPVLAGRDGDAARARDLGLALADFVLKGA